jgi:hypothetical protein
MMKHYEPRAQKIIPKTPNLGLTFMVWPSTVRVSTRPSAAAMWLDPFANLSLQVEPYGLPTA